MTRFFAHFLNLVSLSYDFFKHLECAALLCIPGPAYGLILQVNLFLHSRREKAFTGENDA